MVKGGRLKCINSEYNIIMKTREKGFNIDTTKGQYQYLYDLVMYGYEMNFVEDHGLDMQTYDNLVDAICNAKETYL